MSISIEDSERLHALWCRAQARVYQELADAFPGQDPDLVFMTGIVRTLAWTLRSQPVDDEIVELVLNQMLAEGYSGPETGWRLVRMT